MLWSGGLSCALAKMRTERLCGCPLFNFSRQVPVAPSSVLLSLFVGLAHSQLARYTIENQQLFHNCHFFASTYSRQ